MGKRAKRLRKGIDSISKQIEIHRLKRETALDEGMIERAEYYEGEIIWSYSIKNILSSSELLAALPKG